MTRDELDLVHSRKRKYKCYLRSRKIGTAQSICKHKALCNAVTCAMQQAKRDFFIKGARSGSKFFWRHVKWCTGLGRMKARASP